MTRADAPPAIREAATPAEIADARALFEAYAAWLAVDLCFQGFARELATLPGAYARPRGRLLVAYAGERPVGCIALRPLQHSDDTGEVKRLWVEPAAQGGGVGRRLAQTLIEAARSIGYRALVLDTLPRMNAALALYASLGFRPIEPYYHNPVPGTVYLSLALAGAAQPAISAP